MLEGVPGYSDFIKLFQDGRFDTAEDLTINWDSVSGDWDDDRTVRGFADLTATVFRFQRP
jgi:hypothetical protein